LGWKVSRILGRSKEWTKVLGCRPAGNSGERQGLHVAERLAGAGDLAVFGAEIVAPLRDAMRLVHREPPHAGPAQGLHAAVHQQTFRRDEQQPQLTGADLAPRLP
jgi:hypothetical protein